MGVYGGRDDGVVEVEMSSHAIGWESVWAIGGQVIYLLHDGIQKARRAFFFILVARSVSGRFETSVMQVGVRGVCYLF